MSKTFLLVDFGASRIKTCIYRNSQIESIKDFLPSAPCDTTERKFVVSLDNIEKQFREIVASYCDFYKIDAIYICSEMHGFAVLDKNNNPISDYISWKDERCLNCSNGTSTFDLLKDKYSEVFYNITGMRPRPCYPFFNLYEYVKNCSQKEIKIVSLPEFICTIDDQSTNISHSTMSAGLGFYDIYKKEFSNYLISIYKDLGINLLFNKPSDNIVIGGYLCLNHKNIPIYTGVGDHQCAVLGAGNTAETISLNLGTGSQVGVIGENSSIAEKRPYFNDEIMSVVTHIPSGRSFNAYINFLYEVNPDRNFWQMLSEIKLSELKLASLDIDLALFSSAWNFDRYGQIANINEKKFNFKKLFGFITKKLC